MKTLYCPTEDVGHNYKKIKTPDYLLVPTSVGGVLYPSGALHQDVFPKEIFKKHGFFADDLWLKVNEVRNKVKVVTSTCFNKDLSCIGVTQKEKLVTYNSFGAGNDEQLQNICSLYSINFAELRNNNS